MNLYERLFGVAAPTDPLLEVGDRVWTYADIDTLAVRMAARLRASEVPVGGRVVAAVEKSAEALALYLACLRAGVVYIPANPAFTEAELDVVISDAEPHGVVLDPSRAGAAWTLGANGSGTLLDGLPADVPDVTPQRDTDVAAMLYTSGTTGRPKGAMLSHGALADNAVMLTEAWGFGRDDVLVHTLPIFHVHGLFVAMHCAMLSGSRVRFLPRFDVSTVLAALQGASVMMGVPTYYNRLLADDRLDRSGCATMRLFISGSAPLSEVTHAAFAERTGHEILERYGMTEAGMICSNPLAGPRMPGSVGFPLPSYEARVVGEAGDPCASGEVGTLEVRGPSLFSGYWQRPDATAGAFRDGFFATGDLATMSPDGRVRLVGRASDVIITGGFNVYPKEVEQAIEETTAVTEVAVVGLPDDDLGEVVVAFVVADSFDEPTVRAALADLLARYKQPRRYVEVDELPRNAMGKVQKSVLRQR